MKRPKHSGAVVRPRNGLTCNDTERCADIWVEGTRERSRSRVWRRDRACGGDETSAIPPSRVAMPLTVMRTDAVLVVVFPSL